MKSVYFKDDVSIDYLKRKSNHMDIPTHNLVVFTNITTVRPTWPPTPPPIRGTVPPLSKWDVYEDPTKVTKTISKADEPSKEDWQKTGNC